MAPTGDTGPSCLCPNPGAEGWVENGTARVDVLRGSTVVNVILIYFHFLRVWPGAVLGEGAGTPEQGLLMQEWPKQGAVTGSSEAWPVL